MAKNTSSQYWSWTQGNDIRVGHSLRAICSIPKAQFGLATGLQAHHLIHELEP